MPVFCHLKPKTKKSVGFRGGRVVGQKARQKKIKKKKEKKKKTKVSWRKYSRGKSPP